LDHTSSNTGPRDFKLQYSTTGVGAFIDTGLTYSVLANAAPNPVWGGTYAPEHTIDLDLRTLPVLNNLTDVWFRVVMDSTVSANGGAVAATGTSRVDNVRVVYNFEPLEPPPPPPAPRLPESGDIVLGLNTSSPIATFELVSGPVSANGGVEAGTPWQSENFIQSVEFDNYGGQPHNVRGNLLGVDRGGTISGGTGLIYSFATHNGSIPLPAPQLIGNSCVTCNAAAGGAPIGHTNLTPTQMSALSVSPDNSKIAVMGDTTGKVLVYDYTAGDTEGAGASLSGGRETAGQPMTIGSSQGTTWIDDDTVIAFTTLGDIVEVDATTMATQFFFPVTTPNFGSGYTSLAYNPEISDYVYAMYSGFVDPTGVNFLYILDPANNYSLVHEIDLSTSIADDNSAREIALDEDGNLFFAGFDGTVGFISAADLAAGNDNSSVLWYDSTTFASFPGLDIALGESGPVLPGDFNGDNVVNAADYAIWAKGGPLLNDTAPPGAGPEDYDAWAANFGATLGSGGGGENGAVPEPACLTLLAMAALAFAWRRQR
jgi:hypothetical protein